MIKEPYRDYATTAFLYYASIGCPTVEQYEKSIRDEVNRRLATLSPDIIYLRATAAVSIRKPLINDIDAVNKMFEMLRENNKDYIADAVKRVYMTNPPKNLSFRKREIQDRVCAYMMTAHLGERTVYRYLKHARQLFAIIRGLTVATECDLT